MGNLAIRFPDRLLLWNGEAMEVTNDKDANAYVRRPVPRRLAPVEASGGSPPLTRRGEPG